MKFEKVMKKFCKDIGLDKKTFLNMMLGTSTTNFEESTKKEHNSSKDNLSLNTVTKEGGTGVLNTGVAA